MDIILNECLENPKYVDCKNVFAVVGKGIEMGIRYSDLIIEWQNQ